MPAHDVTEYIGYTQGSLTVLGPAGINEITGNTMAWVECSGGTEKCRGKYKTQFSSFLGKRPFACYWCSRKLNNKYDIKPLPTIFDKVVRQKWGWGTGRFSYL